MQIEFDPGRIGPFSSALPTVKGRTAAPAPLGDQAALEHTGALQSALNEALPVRAEKVAAARAAVADTNFPPEAMMKAIAALLAQNIQQS
ncbi:MAG TPA: hypothetical protein VFB55_12385 [Verrucomicrobiae bacterium]|nr:hypothetical protein [Verrucomicrobiae bacterium]